MNRRRNDEQGFVMVCVLWVVALLTVLTIGFNHRALLDRKAAAFALDHDLAMMQARGAVQRGIVEVRNKYLKDLMNPEPNSSTHLGQSWARETNLLTNPEYFDGGPNFRNDGVWFYIEDMERRININNPRDIIEHMPQLDTGTVRRIHHRLGFDRNRRIESFPFHALEEVRFVRGIDEEDWEGEDEMPGLKDLLSIYGNGFINVNTAGAEVLGVIPDLAPGIIDKILGYRAGADGVLNTADDQGFKSSDHLFSTLGLEGRVTESIKKYCTYTSNFFKITGVATRRQGKVRAQCSAVVEVTNDPNYPPDVRSWEETPLGA